MRWRTSGGNSPPPLWWSGSCHVIRRIYRTREPHRTLPARNPGAFQRGSPNWNLGKTGGLIPRGSRFERGEEEDDEDFRLAPPDTPSKLPSFVANEEVASSSSRPPPRRPARSRNRPSGGNPVREIIKIVAGGVVGLTIGQLILWWMPGNWTLSNRDPAGIGARVGSYVPWLVPAGVRGEPQVTWGGNDFLAEDSRPRSVPFEIPRSGNSSPDPRAEASDGSVPNDSADDAPTGDFTERERDGFLPEAIDLTPNDSALVDPALVDPAGDEAPLPVEDTRPLDDSPVEADFGPEESDAISEREAEEPLSDTAPGVDGPLPSTRATAVRQAPRFEPAQLAAVVEEVREGVGSWHELDAETGALTVYAALARASMVVPFTDAAQTETRAAVTQLRRLLTEILGDESLRQGVVAQAVATPLGDRTGQEGTLVLGVVDRVESRGRLFATTVQQENGDRIDVISTVDPTGRLPLGQEVLALGIAILEPRRELIGYDGVAEPVLYGSLVVPIGR
jgi:hypothetical protein